MSRYHSPAINKHSNDKYRGKTLFITGASRGVGKEIALKAARDGANIVVAAKTAEPHQTLPGTIYDTVKEVEGLGGKGLACVVDVRDEIQVTDAVQKAVETFGGIDILVNNASSLWLHGTQDTTVKRYNLLYNINSRGTFLVSKLCLPFLKKSQMAHILNICPPMNMDPALFSSHLAYTVTKYGMSMCVLGMHEEFKPFKIAVNALWPRTPIDTAALRMHPNGEERRQRGRKPTIVADAAYWILTQDPKPNGEFFIDEEVLMRAGITEFDQYAVNLYYKDNLDRALFVPQAIVSSKCRL